MVSPELAPKRVILGTVPHGRWRVVNPAIGVTERQPDENVAIWSLPRERGSMYGIVYLVGLIVIIMAILSFVGIH